MKAQNETAKDIEKTSSQGQSRTHIVYYTVFTVIVIVDNAEIWLDTDIDHT